MKTPPLIAAGHRGEAGGVQGGEGAGRTSAGTLPRRLSHRLDDGRAGVGLAHQVRGSVGAAKGRINPNYYY